MKTFDEAAQVYRDYQMSRSEGEVNKYCRCEDIYNNKQLIEDIQMLFTNILADPDIPLVDKWFSFATLVLETGIAIGTEMEKE